MLGSISSRLGSPVVYPPPSYGCITGPWRLFVTSHPLFMQITTQANSEGKRWRGLLIRKILNLLARMCSMWKCFGYFKEKHKSKTGTRFKATRNRSQQESRHNIMYACNDCHKSLSKQILRSQSKSSILSPNGVMQENYLLKPGMISQCCIFSLPLL